MTAADGGPRVAICIVTRERPVTLAGALESVGALEVAARPLVVVVDNDPAESARSVCDDARSRLDPLALHYVVEAEPGIPFARNRAVEEALDLDAEFIAFLDDDEVAAADWLARLLDTQARTGSAIVTGPSLPVFGEDAPAWAIDGGFFEPTRFPSGSDRDRAYTNNVLVAADVFRGGLRFDPRLRMTGGSDTHLFLRARAAGHRIVWADDAITSEVVPASRATVSWILRRAYRLGTMTAFMARDLSGALRGGTRVLVTGFYRLLKGALMLPFTLLLGRRFWVWSARHLAYGAGMIAGLLGIKYHEYRRRHGS